MQKKKICLYIKYHSVNKKFQKLREYALRSVALFIDNAEKKKTNIIFYLSLKISEFS